MLKLIVDNDMIIKLMRMVVFVFYLCLMFFRKFVCNLVKKSGGEIFFLKFIGLMKWMVGEMENRFWGTIIM